MDSGLYAACAGLMARTDTLDTLASNLANASTSGYRGQGSSFDSVLATAHGRPATTTLNAVTNTYGIAGSPYTSSKQGSILSTGNPTDFAVQGPGYFAVQTAAGTRFTRAGAFHVAAQGQLATADGDAVLGSDGAPIRVVAGDFSVSQDGTISSGGAVAGKLRLVEFAADTKLQPAGRASYMAPAGSERVAAQSTVQQGALESSNVDPVTSVVALIDAQRNAETMRRALSLFDSEIDKTAAQDLPRVQA